MTHARYSLRNVMILSSRRAQSVSENASPPGLTMKDLVQCRKLEAKFRQLAVSDPTKRFIWLAEAEKWEHEAEAEIASHFEACNAVRTTGAIDQ
jgi:hypothetical protein